MNDEVRLERLREAVSRVPTKPGVYLMKDARGHVIYVGKAISLRNRLRTYFAASSRHVPRTQAMVRQVEQFDYIVVGNAVEALILEANLIKEHSPRYNVRLKDDKAYPFVKVSLGEPFPRIYLVRRRSADGARYFGPYTDVRALRETLDILRRFFPVRTCRKPLSPEKKAERPCLNAHLGRCLGPCAGLVTPEEYRRAVEEAMLFLEGRHDRLLPELQRQMEAAAEELAFERAARLRDQLQALSRVGERQKVVAGNLVDQDLAAVAVAESRDLAVVQIFQVRGGKLVGRLHFLLEEVRDRDRGEVLAAFLAQYYLEAASIPPEVLVGADFGDRDALAGYLSGKRGRTVKVRVPQRGGSAQLLAMAEDNAKTALEEEIARLLGEQALREGAAVTLAAALGLPTPPRRIECYDISHTQGTETVGSMVVFIEGRPKTSEYRRFKLRTITGPDDFASLQEVIRRRFLRARAEEDEANQDVQSEADQAPHPPAKFAERPDLMIIDGGKGQLSSVLEEMSVLGVEGIPVVGLAKEEEHLFRPGESDPVILAPGSPALHLVQHIRDEAHRFAVTYHRELRDKRVRGSALDEVSGIGPHRKKALLKQFGSVSAIRRATPEELTAVPGITSALAERILSVLQGRESN